MKPSEFGPAMARPFDHVPEQTLAADVFVVEWAVAAESASDDDPIAEQWWRNEGVAASFEI